MLSGNYSDQTRFDPHPEGGTSRISDLTAQPSPLVSFLPLFLSFRIPFSFFATSSSNPYDCLTKHRQTIVGVGSMIIVNRPEYLEWIQKTNFQNYDKGWLFRSRFQDLLGTNGVFVADGKVVSRPIYAFASCGASHLNVFLFSPIFPSSFLQSVDSYS